MRCGLFRWRKLWKEVVVLISKYNISQDVPGWSNYQRVEYQNLRGVCFKIRLQLMRWVSKGGVLWMWIQLQFLGVDKRYKLWYSTLNSLIIAPTSNQAHPDLYLEINTTTSFHIFLQRKNPHLTTLFHSDLIEKCVVASVTSPGKTYPHYTSRKGDVFLFINHHSSPEDH